VAGAAQLASSASIIFCSSASRSCATSQPVAVFKIASVTSSPAVLTCIVGDLLVRQSQDHPMHIPRSCASKLTRSA
jgi:hypothetical protein